MRRLARTLGFLLFITKVSARPSSLPAVNGILHGKKDRRSVLTRSAYLKRRIAWIRGGSSEQEYEADASSDDTWMKVNAVLDLESALSDSEIVKEIENNVSDIPGLSEEMTVDVEEEVSDALKLDQSELPTDDSDKASTEETLSIDEEAEIEANKTKEMILNLTFYASKHGDGSESDPDGLPARFLKMQKGNRERAKTAFAHTVSWREEYDINNLLSRPHSQFDACKVIFPHYFPGRDPSNNIIFVQRPGRLDMDLAHRNNVSNDDLIMHYVYIVEYCWNLIEPGPPDGVMTNVIDLTDLTFKKIKNKEMMDFAKRFVSIMSHNYPSRSFKTLVINAPRWFNVGYKIFKPLLRESTKAKIQIFSAGPEQDAALREFLGDSVPEELLSTYDGSEQQENVTSSSTDDSDGGEDINEPTPGPNSIIEQELRTFCMNRLEEAGSTMKDVMA